MIKRILVGLDGSPTAESILSEVGTLAKRLGSEVILLSVVELPEDLVALSESHNLQDFVDHHQATARAYLHSVERNLAAQKIRTNSVVVVGDPSVEILTYAKHRDIDLIALATHGRSGFDRLLYGSVAEEVVHTSTLPVLLLRPDPDAHASEETLLRQILVPLDGSSVAECALDVAADLAQHLNVAITLMRVTEPAAVIGDAGMGLGYEYGKVIEAVQEGDNQYLQGVRHGLKDHGLAVTAVCPVGFAAAEIAAYYEVHPGTVIIMATHGRSGVADFLLGSVARRVVKTSRAPVLLVRPTAPAATPAA